jgi:nucleoid-associated protein YgaU
MGDAPAAGAVSWIVWRDRRLRPFTTNAEQTPLTQGCGVTREQKLALIIGFSLVMVVGVLISDHFSRARTEALGQALDQREGGGGSRIDPISLVQDEPPLDEAWVREPLPSHDPVAQAPPAAQSEPPVAIVMGVPPEQDPLAPAAADPGTLALAGPPLSQQTPLADSVGPPAGASSALSNVQPSSPAHPPVADPLSEMFEPVYATRAAEPRTEPVSQKSPVRERTHIVAEDESLWKIAEREYGDGSLWTRIRDRNPTLVSEDGEVRAGIKLAIPLDGSASGEKKPASAPPTRVKEKKDSATPRTYIVRKGDSLGEIAQRELGSARRWPEIVKLNHLDDPDDVPAGLALRLPS